MKVAVDIEDFRQLCHNLVGQRLLAHSFEFTGETREGLDGDKLLFQSLVFRRPVIESAPRYILFQLVTARSSNVQLVQWVQVLLDEFLNKADAGFNSVSIWEVIDVQSGAVDTRNFVIRPDNPLEVVLGFAVESLFTNASEFIAGELQVFGRVRQKIAELRKLRKDHR